MSKFEFKKSKFKPKKPSPFYKKTKHDSTCRQVMYNISVISYIFLLLQNWKLLSNSYLQFVRCFFFVYSTDFGADLELFYCCRHMGPLKSMKYGSLLKVIRKFTMVRQNYGTYFVLYVVAVFFGKIRRKWCTLSSQVNPGLVGHPNQKQKRRKKNSLSILCGQHMKQFSN